MGDSDKIIKINLGDSAFLQTYYFTRYAILVKKLPRDAKIQMWFSPDVINWDPNG